LTHFLLRTRQGFGGKCPRIFKPSDCSPSFEAERPQHPVAFRYPFAVGKYDVTRGEFAAFVAETGYDPAKEGCQGLSGTGFQQSAKYSWRNPGFPQTDDHPVVCVSWNDAQAYLQWLGRKTGKSWHLLSEAEWEYSARAGTKTPYWWGASVDTGCVFANMADISAKTAFPFWGVTGCDDRHVYTSPVGFYAPNPAGLYDISGNVWQWLGDCWTRDYSHAPENGATQLAGRCNVHVIRGGAWNDRPRGIRLAYRAKGRSEVRAAGIGFRVARTIAPSELNPTDLRLIARNCDQDHQSAGLSGCTPTRTEQVVDR
jgi:formylglycine-generating enzyme required for sulfatase activity